MDTFSWLVCLVLLLVLFQVSRKLGRTNRLPPGPPAIPIFGNLFQLGGKPHRTLAELAKKLDANQHLRRNKVEQLLADVGDSSHIGESIEISTVAFKTTLNLISNTIFSVDYADPSSNTALEFREILQVIKEELGKANFGDLFPTLAKLDLQGIRRRMAIHSKKMMNIFDKEIDNRSELRKMNDYIPAQEFLDTLLQISEDDNEELDRNLIKHLFFDLFTAGTDTTTSTLEWAWRSYFITQKLYRKLHPPVPFLLPRKAEVDIKIHNFVIPKGAQVLINAYVIGRDPNFWEEPELFSLERFIESEIDVKGTNFGLVPFGGGRRICP
ncbi:hypothetical protein Golax_024811 [Gossypium laxum]|uniref:Cytochrome P450 n=1 Tax=Gossypium laxum TaxID=34288 RepID=A0A7J8ZDT7_9ROSI|nr:hypothetical protein [Gossypium laxum]